MKYPAQLFCSCSPTAVLNAKYATQGAADQAGELFRAIHGKVDCCVMRGLPKRDVGAKVTTSSGKGKGRRGGLAYDDDEYHSGGR